MINDLDIVQWDYLLSPEFEMINSAGKPLTGGYIEVYIHGTRDKYYCASDFNGTLHPFQIPLDSIGSNVILASPENAYDVYVYNKFGSLIMSRYNVHCQGGNGGSSTYVGDKLYYGQYRASNVTTIANLRRNKGNINLTSNGYLKLKNGMSYHITVRGAFQVDDVTNTETTLNYIEYTSVNPIKIDIDETKEGPQYFELSYDIYRLPEDMDYQIAFAQSNGMVTELLVEVHSLSNLATSSAGGDQEYEPGWGIDITNNVISVDPSILEALEYNAGDYISIVDNTISVTGIDPNSYATHDEVHEATVTAIEYVTGIIPEAQVQSNWDETDDTQPSYIQNKPDLSIYATHDEVNNVSGQIIETVNNVSGVLHEEITNNTDTVIETINNVSGILHEEIIETAQVVTSLIPTDYTTHEEVNEAIVTAIDLVTGMIPDPQVQSDWEQSDDTQPDYIKNKPDLDIYATHDEVNTVSGQIIETVNNVSGDIIATVNNVSGDIIETVNNVSAVLHGEIENIPEQQQSDWDQSDVTQVDYIKNKPDLSIYATHDEVTDAVTSIDLSEFATHTEVYDSSVTAIQLVTGLIPDAQVQSDWDQDDDTQVDYIKNKPDLDIYVTHDELIEVVSAVTGIGDYGQFYSTAVSGAAVMARTKGTIDVTNDGKIKLKKGSSYHVTVRGRYNQTTPNNVYSNISYIEYITFNNININVDKSITESQYFEISYDLYKLNSDTDYYIFFSGLEGTVNDLFIEIHAIGSVGAGVSGGAGTEYDAGWGIQILNNVISVDPSIFNDYVTENELVTAIQSVVTAIPSEQVQSDWTEDDTADPAYIQNKPEEIPLIAGDNIGIFDIGASIVIAASGTDLSDYVTQEELAITVTAVTAAIPEAQVQSDWTEDDNTDPAYIQNKPVEYNLIAGQNIGIIVNGTDVTIAASGSDLSDYATHTEVYNAVVTGVQAATSLIPDTSDFTTHTEVSEAIVTAIDLVTGLIPDAQIQSDWTEADIADPAYIKNKPTEIGMYAGEGITIEVTGVSAIISAQGGGGTAYEAGQYISIDSNDVISVTGLAPVSSIPDSEEVEFEELDITQFALASAIPVVTGFATKSELSDVEATIPTVQLNGDDQVTAINNHEIAGTGGTTYTAGDYIDITNDTISVTGLDNSNIFWAIYRTTTYNEITDAITAGKKIFLKKDNTILPFYGKSGTQYRFTTGIAPDLTNSIPGYYYHYVTSNNGWYGGTYYVQSNWNETDNRSPRYINNKPSIPTIQLNGDDQVTAINNYPLAGGGGGGTTYTAGDYISIANDVISVTGVAPATAIPEVEEVEFEELDLSNYALASAIPAAQVNSDWNANSGVAEILNKPTEIQLIAGTNVQIEVSGVSAVISAQGGGGAQVQADWDETDTSDPSYIQNKPTEKNLVAGANVTITESNDEVTIETTEIASGLTLVAGDNVTITVSGNNLVVNAAKGVTKTLLYTGSSTDSRSGTFTLNQSAYNFDRLEMTLIDVNDFVIKQICEMPADGLVNSNGTRGSSFNSITSGTQTWFKAMNWQINAAGTTLTYWVDEIATSGNSVTAINRSVTSNRPIMLRIYGVND